MAIAYIQSATFENNIAGPTCVQAFGSNITSGSALIAVIYGYEGFGGGVNGTTVSGITDTRSNTWTLGKRQVTPGGSDGTLEIWYALNSTAGANTVTATFTNNEEYRTMFVGEYSGVATASAVDGTASSNTGTSTTYTAGSITTTQNGSLILGGLVTVNASGPFTAGGSFTKRQERSDNFVAYEDWVQTTAGAVNPSMTGSSDNFAMVGLALKAAGGGGGGTAVPVFMHNLRMQGIA